MESLGAKQRRFCGMMGKLISHIYESGYECSFGHALRCEDCPTGHKTSLHKIRLAVDLNLFKNGEYLPSSEAHKPFGEYWESIGGTWGGRFQDGNHYSLAHNGMK